MIEILSPTIQFAGKQKEKSFFVFDVREKDCFSIDKLSDPICGFSVEVVFDGAMYCDLLNKNKFSTLEEWVKSRLLIHGNRGLEDMYIWDLVSVRRDKVQESLRDWFHKCDLAMKWSDLKNWSSHVLCAEECDIKNDNRVVQEFETMLQQSKTDLVLITEQRHQAEIARLKEQHARELERHGQKCVQSIKMVYFVKLCVRGCEDREFVFFDPNSVQVFTKKVQEANDLLVEKMSLPVATTECKIVNVCDKEFVHLARQ